MHFAWRLLWLCVGITLLPNLSSGCTLSSINLSTLNETIDSETVLWTSPEITATTLDATRFAIGENGYDHADAFLVEIDRSGAEGTFKIIFKPGPRFRDYADISPPRTKGIDAQLNYTCNGVESAVSVLGFWTDINTRGPEFLGTPPSPFSITTNWDKNVPLNWGTMIEISDQDHDFVNAPLPTLSTSRDDVVRVVATPRFEDNGTIPPQYLWDVQIFIQEGYQLIEEQLDIEITASDGVNNPPSQLPIILNVAPANTSPPRFTRSSYHHKLTDWPKPDVPFSPDEPIGADDPDGTNFPISYRLDSSDVEFVSEDDPTEIKFLKEILPTDPRHLIIVDIIATIVKEGISLESKSSLILELPALSSPIFTTDEEFTVPKVAWNVEPGVVADISVQNVVTNVLSPFTPTFKINSVYPARLFDKFEVVTTDDNSLHITYQDIMVDAAELLLNNVVTLTIQADVGDGNSLRTNVAMMTLYFPEKAEPTTEPPTTCPELTTEMATTCPSCSTTEEPTTPVDCITPEPTTCPECPSTGTDPSFTCPTQPTTTCEPCDYSTFSTDPSKSTSATEASTHASTTDSGSCPPCTTTNFPTTDCSSSTLFSCPEPTCPTESTCPTMPTCPPEVTCPACPTDPTCPTMPTCPPEVTCPACPTDPTCPTMPTCPTDPTCPTMPTCPTDPTCPTMPTCPTDPTCPTLPTCPTDPTCPTMPTCPTDPTCPTLPTCPTDPTCPTMPTCPPEVTCPTNPTCPPENTDPTCPPQVTCPTNPTCPTVPTCPPQVTCPTVTPCPFDCNTCPTSPPVTCPTDAPPQDCDVCSESDCSNTGMLAGIISVSVLFAASLGLAGFLYMKWKAASSFSSFNSKSSPSNNPRVSFAQPDKSAGGDFHDDGWMNPAFNSEPSSSGLEQVLTHPEPSTSAAAFSPAPPVASPYMTSPIEGAEGSTPMKSSLAKPKEIAPDYEEGLGKTSSEVTPKPKTGVKIADEVEIINKNDLEDERL